MTYFIAFIIIVIAGFAITFMRQDTTTPLGETPIVVEEAPQNKDGGSDTKTTPVVAEPNTQPVAVPQTPSPQPETTQVPAEVATIYEDGVHKTAVTYMTPKRDTYLLDVSMTLNDDVVTNASITYSQGAEKDPNAQRFEKAYKTEVIGKKLDAINLSRVGGASLTTKAFNDAVAKIKSEAQS